MRCSNTHVISLFFAILSLVLLGFLFVPRLGHILLFLGPCSSVYFCVYWALIPFLTFWPVSNVLGDPELSSLKYSQVTIKSTRMYLGQYNFFLASFYSQRISSLDFLCPWRAQILRVMIFFAILSLSFLEFLFVSGLIHMLFFLGPFYNIDF